MTKAFKWILAGLGAVLALILALVITIRIAGYFGTPGIEHRQREAALAPLLREHASRQHVIQTLALNFADYSDPKTRTSLLDTFSSVRQRAQPYPTILFHSTMWTTTFLFFDAQDRLQDYYIGAQ